MSKKTQSAKRTSRSKRSASDKSKTKRGGKGADQRRRGRRFGALWDPYAEREAQRYEHPIPSRESILSYLADRGALADADTLADELELDEESEREALRRRLGRMLREGEVMQNRRGAYGVAEKMDLMPGRVLANPDGFGFLRPDTGSQDLFLAPREMRSVLHGDRVLGSVIGVDRRGRPQAAVAEILERRNHQLVGRYVQESGVAFVTPDDRRIHQDVVIPPGKEALARDGQMVLARVVKQPDHHSPPVGEVMEVLGATTDAAMAVDIAVRSHGLPTGWSVAVDSELRRFGDEVAPEHREGRVDLRNRPLVTIDGADAKDFDDAVLCEPRKNGWRLFVAIADVSAYVEPDTALDEAARERGTSAYFPGHVVPMLPEKLSNGLCSLNPDVDRLCMVCELTIDGEGKTTRSRFYEAVMRSHARLTYDEVWAAIGEGDKRLRKRYRKLLPHLEHLFDLYRALRGHRRRRGAIDFEGTEVTFELDETGNVADIVPLERNDAHKVIEECMIAANVAAAKFLERRRIPAPFRVHPPPQADRLEDLRQFLGELGLKFPRNRDPVPADFAKLLRRIEDRPDAGLIQTVLLRAQSLAVYQADNEGHFGLALEAYTHFTSPIRRYADLLVHRAIRHLINDGKPDAFAYTRAQMHSLTEHCSMADRRAEEAARDVDDRLKCVYMADHVGDRFDGLVSGVTSFGLFVELERTRVQGLVHVTALPNDYYHFDPVGHRLTGERTGMVYRLADKVSVEVVRVDADERKIDFELVAPLPRKEPGRKKGKRRRRKTA